MLMEGLRIKDGKSRRVKLSLICKAGVKSELRDRLKGRQTGSGQGRKVDGNC